MSFFGQQNNNQQPASGFGGFGSNNNNNNNTPSGFGQPQNTAFGGGTNNSGGSLFGSTNSGFGTGGTGFGTSTTATNPFGGNRPAFGTSTTSSGSMFGSNNTPTAGASNAFGGFGGTNNSNTSGSLFGAPSKPGFGTGNTSSGSLFGGGSGGSTFGTSNNQTTSAFGNPLSSALGSNTADCQGTGSTPFQAYTEKESGTNVSNQYQSISFMQNYKNFSFEELRLADYNQGRRYGNGSGQPGAFGVGSNFGGFGQNTGGTFGAPGGSGGGIFGASSAASPFGGTATASGGFGGGSTGGLFGGNNASKPAGSLFGGTNTTSAQPSGGIFGTSNQAGFGAANASTGFGSGNTGGLFGGNQQQAQKSGFTFNGGTGSSNAFQPGGTNPTNNTGGGLFGGQTTSAFGGGQQQQQPPASNPFGGFGGNQNQVQSGNSAFGGFGATNQQAQKPGGLFGAAPAAGDGAGLFGGNNQQNNQPQPASGSIFGSGAGNQTGGGSLFGQKPAATGTGLFGANPTNTTNTLGGGGLFGGSALTANNNPNQPNQSGGLFGSNSQLQQPKPGGLFGSTGTSTGGGLFNNNTQQASGGSLFGNLGSNNPSQSTSLFGSSNNAASSSGFQQPNVLHPPQTQLATLENSPYGNNSIFYGLPQTIPVNLGPVATPITTTQKLKKSAALPQYKINPLQSTRLATPQKRGFGFTYSSYGTPSSALSTPGGLNSSLLSSSIGRGLGKSLSTSNIRQLYDNNEESSILSPGAFSAGSSRFAGAGSLKKLTIDRSLRTNIFSGQNASTSATSEKFDQLRQPGILKKKVSFDASTVGGNGSGQDNTDSNGINGFAIEDSNNNAASSTQEQGFSRSPVRGQSRSGTSKINGASFEPEMEQVKGNELAIVHEDGSPEPLDGPANRLPVSVPQGDPVPGEYYMDPPRQELDRMSKDDLKHLSGFIIGRHNCGRVTFDEPVDVTLTSLDDIYIKIALIELRSLTVYPDSDIKPPVGRGLNVPSTIYLENSWPRGKDRRTPSHEKSGPRFNKHVDRLRKVTDTEFVRYERDTGTWVFKVPHFTTYAFEYDETGSEGDSLQTSALSEPPPDTPTPKYRAPRNGYTPEVDDSVQQSSILSDEQCSTSSSPDDTFEFRKKKILPGAFDESGPFEDDLEMEESSDNNESFLDDRLAASSFDSGTDEPSELQDSEDKILDRSLIVRDDDLGMAGSFPQADSGDANAGVGEGLLPKSILKVTHQDKFNNGTPLRFNPSGDWAEELQRTISPRKQDRQALRETQGHVHEDQGISREGTPKAVWKPNGASAKLATSIDLMNSLFGQEEARRSGRGVKQTAKGKGFEWPYSKESKTREGEMSQADQEFHKSYKPHWGPQTTLLYAMASNINLSQSKSTQTMRLLNDQRCTFVSEGKDIRFAKFAACSPLITKTLIKQRSDISVAYDRGVPYVEVQRIPFKEMAASVDNKDNHEHSVWELAAILFDDSRSDVILKDSTIDQETFNQRVRKDDLILMWQGICQASALKAVAEAPDAEQRAIAHLSANDVVEACDELVRGQDYRLAILMAQVNSDRIIREDMATQISQWRDLNVLSEFTEPIRALYGFLAGNTCVCEGKKGPLEDRAKTFVISEQFHMDWKRAFGLRLWYAILPEEPIEAAVKRYSDDLETHERQKPLPWFLEEQSPSPWKDPNADQREDILWGLLKLYAASQGFLRTPTIESIVSPHNTAGNPLDCRLSFQLHHALAPRFPHATDPAKGDQLALGFSAQLDSAGEWLWAIFILLHLSSCEQRQSCIQTLLTLHSTDIVDADDPAFHTLTEEFKIPKSWVWEAKALHARSVTQNRVHEVEFLLRAQNWEEAHKTLCRVVAPRAIIERDHDGLKGLLDAFGDGSRFVGDWDLGGGVYEDFVALFTDDWKTGFRQDPAKFTETGRMTTLRRLLGSLPSMVQERIGRAGLEEVVAVQEMSEYVARAVASSRGKGAKQGTDPWRILQLPLAEKGYLTHGVELGLEYYEAVMAGESGR